MWLASSLVIFKHVQRAWEEAEKKEGISPACCVKGRAYSKSSRSCDEEEATAMRKKKEEREDEGSDIGLEGLGLGGLFKGIGKLVDLASKIDDAGGEIRKEGEIDLGSLKKGMKGVFGFSVKTALGGKPVVESFGNIKKTAKGPVVEEIREPITDVFDEEKEIRVYAEMPGVSREDIDLDLKEDILEISAQSGDRKYHKEVLLPAKVKPDSLNFNYKNGILEVRMNK